MPFFFMIPFLGCFFCLTDTSFLVLIHSHRFLETADTGCWLGGWGRARTFTRICRHTRVRTRYQMRTCARTHSESTFFFYTPSKDLPKIFRFAVCRFSLTDCRFLLSLGLQFDFRFYSFAQRSFPGCLMPHFFRSTGVSHPNLLDQCRLSVGQLLDAKAVLMMRGFLFVTVCEVAYLFDFVSSNCLHL